MSSYIKVFISKFLAFVSHDSVVIVSVISNKPRTTHSADYFLNHFSFLKYD